MVCNAVLSELRTSNVRRRYASGRGDCATLAKLAAVLLPQSIYDAVQQERLACNNAGHGGQGHVCLNTEGLPTGSHEEKRLLACASVAGEKDVLAFQNQLLNSSLQHHK